MKAANRWIQSTPDIITKRNIAYVACNGKPLSDSYTLRKFACRKREEKWIDFEDFVCSETLMYRISYSDDMPVLDYTCTCSQFLLEYVCIHVLALANLLGKMEFPPEAATGGLGKRKGPGRPKKLGTSLMRD